jgi:hypothetical protein
MLEFLKTPDMQKELTKNFKQRLYKFSIKCSECNKGKRAVDIYYDQLDKQKAYMSYQ